MKPTIMILGSGHLANPGKDTFNIRMDDVLAPKRQDEIKQLVSQLKQFRPTKIALQADQRFAPEINVYYQDYVDGTYDLKRWEHDQIGFRLAKQMGHSKLYCVDYCPEHDPFFPEDLDPNLLDVDKYAAENNQEHLLPKMEDFDIPEGETHEEEDGRVWIQPKKYESIIDMYRRYNEPEGRRADHQTYLRMAQIGTGNQYPGANWVGNHWYPRNLKVFVNLTRITESAEDRILVIIGAGLVFLLHQFIEDCGDYIIESPLKYIKSENLN